MAGKLTKADEVALAKMCRDHFLDAGGDDYGSAVHLTHDGMAYWAPPGHAQLRVYPTQEGYRAGRRALAAKESAGE